MRSFYRLQPLDHSSHIGAVGRILADIAPNNGAGLVNDEHRRARDAFLRVQHVVHPYVSPGIIRKNRIRQLHLARNGYAVGRRIGADRDQFCPGCLDFLIVGLQLAELRAAEPSVMGPVENQKNVLLSLVEIQIHTGSLNRKPRDVWCGSLDLKEQEQAGQ